MFHSEQQIGNYVLIERLGRGGYGEVWLAERRSKFVTTKVAVKLPLDDHIDHEMIKREAQIWERVCGHPNVLPIIEANEYDGQVVIVSEFATDGSLENLLRESGNSLPIARAVEITLGILAGLEFLHSKNIIHRDLKPANILMQGDMPRLADFGISRVMKTTSASLDAAGTPIYMAPEAFDRKRSAQTDVWAVGVMLYQMLTGVLPFRSDDIQDLMAAILMRDPEPMPIQIPVALKAVVTKALAKHPSQRYQSAGDFRGDLKGFVNKSPSQASGDSLRTRELPNMENSTIGPRSERRTIAILPFVNVTSDAAFAFYEFSLADAVTTELARLRGLIVRPSSVIAKYQGKIVNPREAGKEMSVSTVLSAAFIQSGNHLRVTAQLLDVDTGEIIWSDRIDSETSDIFALQDTITKHIIHGLEFDLSIGELERLGLRPTKSNEAYEEYLRGRDQFARFIFRTLSPADCEAGVRSFERAVEIDPKFALAWSGLGACFANKVFRALGDAEDYRRAEPAFQRALELDPNITEARVLMGFIYLSRGEKNRARAEAFRVVELFPYEAPPYFLKAVVHRLDGEYDEALKAWDRLERVHPGSTVIANWNRARIFSLQGHNELALEEIERGAALEPDHPMIKVFKAQTLYYKADVVGAAKILKLVKREHPHLEGILALLAAVLAAKGEHEEARTTLNHSVLSKASADSDVSYWVASTYALLGEIDDAFRWLEKSIHLGLEDWRWFQRDPYLESLRGDIRFEAIVERLSRPNEDS